jgi:thiol:disulfide interchange protein DsbA
MLMMGRPLFTRVLFGLSFAAAAAVAFMPAAHAQGTTPREGVEFRLIDPPQPADDASKIEVVEFFWYSCPHCNAFEPELVEWARKLPSDVVFKRVPVQFNAGFEPQQRLFYTLEAMGKLDALHGKVFQAIHTQRQPLNTADRIATWAGEQGLDAKAFGDAYKSFGVQSKVQRATTMMKSYGVDGVPMLAIGGRYVTSPSQAGSGARALQVADFLIEQARKQKAK